ncbi:TPA: hypothetical protein DEP96_01195 [Candidatus Uhrbacteria bacterium]|nr:hypothetical protein [Candidatus Uhrbacteria bacterium]
MINIKQAKKGALIVAYALVLLLPLVPGLAHAETAVSTTAASTTTTVTLYNPLGEADVRVIIGRVIKGILGLVGSLAFAMFIYGGMLWMTSAGNADRVKKGQSILVWTVLGLGVIFSSYAAVNAILNAITSGSVSG